MVIKLKLNVNFNLKEFMFYVKHKIYKDYLIAFILRNYVISEA